MSRPRPSALPVAHEALLKLSEVPGVERLTWRLADVARSLGVSRRAIERERSAGRFPKPDVIVGRMPLCRPETIREWLGRAGR